MKHQTTIFGLLHFFFLTFLLMSCQPSLEHLEEVLVIAGSNRPELEKALPHYQQNENNMSLRNLGIQLGELDLSVPLLHPSLFLSIKHRRIIIYSICIR